MKTAKHVIRHEKTKPIVLQTNHQTARTQAIEHIIFTLIPERKQEHYKSITSQTVQEEHKNRRDGYKRQGHLGYMKILLIYAKARTRK